MPEEKTTRQIDIQRSSKEPFVSISTDISALCEILRTNTEPKLRKDAATHLIKLVEDGMDVDTDIIKALFDAEKDISVATELKRLLNKLKILGKFGNDPIAKFDKKLSNSEETTIQNEIAKLRNLYDKSVGEQGAFERKYKVVGQIESGGMGRVYKGLRKSDNKIVAIKFLMLEELSINNNKDRIIARFRREGELLTKRLRLANIIEAYEYGEANGEYFLVMEYMDGGTLEEMIKEKPLDLETFKAISLQLCNAVEHLHRNGIIHRDIKPANILFALDSHGSKQLKLCDFGLSKDKRDPKISRISFQAGTDEYSSHQQLADARTADERDDIFSMGKTFYQMLTGRTFKNDEPYQEIKSYRTDMPESMDSIIRKCIDTDKNNRYQNVGLLRNEIEGI